MHMVLIAVAVVILYITISFALYFKANLYYSCKRLQKVAFAAPAWWVIALIINIVNACIGKDKSFVALIMLKKPYETLLICYSVISLLREYGEVAKKNEKEKFKKRKILLNETNQSIERKLCIT